MNGNLWAQAGTVEKSGTEPVKSGTVEKAIEEKTEVKIKEKETKDNVTDSADNNSVKPEKKSTAKKSAKKFNKPLPAEEETAVKNEKKKDESVPEVQNGSILSLEEGVYKYLRIPGYKPEEKGDKNSEKQVKDEELVRIPDRIEMDDTKKTDVGLFGFSKASTDLLIKIILGIMIFSIFILYRIRSRKKSSGVLRRYPNK